MATTIVERSPHFLPADDDRILSELASQ